jgi:hypothetical protein
MSDFDDEPRGRSATGAVIIAVIFLAILGTGVGIVLGSANKNNGDDQAGGDPTPTASVTATGEPSAGSTGGGKPTKTPTSGTKSYAPTARDKCPEQTQEAAGTTMSVKRYIRTSRSEVWICTGGGKTVYQGRIRGSQFSAATSGTTLFIGSVRYEAGVYAATNGDTVYFVGPDALRREKNGVEEANEPVEDLYEV